jgi:hypothetical protein
LLLNSVPPIQRPSIENAGLLPDGLMQSEIYHKWLFCCCKTAKLPFLGVIQFWGPRIFFDFLKLNLHQANFFEMEKHFFEKRGI